MALELGTYGALSTNLLILDPSLFGSHAFFHKISLDSVNYSSGECHAQCSVVSDDRQHMQEDLCIFEHSNR